MIFTNEKIQELFKQPIAFHRIFAKIAGSVTAGVFLSQAFYWTDKTADGWFYKTQDEWTEETTLTRYEQETAREKLVKIGVLEVKRKGMPAKLYFRLDIERLSSLLLQYAENPQSSMRKSTKQQSGKAPNKNAEIPQTTYKETENTTENTPEDSLSPRKRELSVDEAVEVLESDQQIPSKPQTLAIEIYEDIFPNSQIDGQVYDDFVKILPEVEATVWRQTLMDWRLAKYKASNIPGMISKYKRELKDWQKEQAQEVEQNGTGTNQKRNGNGVSYNGKYGGKPATPNNTDNSRSTLNRINARPKS